MKVKWLKEPVDHDYPASASYLSLIFDKKTVSSIVGKLKKAPLTSHCAKDIFRAAGLPLLGINNYHVKKDTKKIRSGEPISPIVLVRDPANGKVIIADGYHRLCSLYLMDEDVVVIDKIV